MLLVQREADATVAHHETLRAITNRREYSMALSPAPECLVSGFEPTITHGALEFYRHVEIHGKIYTPCLVPPPLGKRVGPAGFICQVAPRNAPKHFNQRHTSMIPQTSFSSARNAQRTPSLDSKSIPAKLSSYTWPRPTTTQASGAGPSVACSLPSAG